jgi:ABC-2 type transport system permease protein
MCAMIVSALGFILTLFRTNGYLFNFREYDMLMALPFKSSAVAACKFLYMYIKCLPWYLSISIAMLAGYGYFAKPCFLTYPVWIVLSFVLPVIPMLIAAFIGFLIARVSTGFRKTNILQAALTIIFALFCVSLRYIIEGIFRNDKVEATLQSAAKITDSVAVVDSIDSLVEAGRDVNIDDTDGFTLFLWGLGAIVLLLAVWYLYLMYKSGDL